MVTGFGDEPAAFAPDTSLPAPANPDDAPKAVPDAFASWFGNDELADVERDVGGGRTIPAHRIVLAQHCEYFRGPSNGLAERAGT